MLKFQYCYTTIQLSYLLLTVTHFLIFSLKSRSYRIKFCIRIWRHRVEKWRIFTAPKDISRHKKHIIVKSIYYIDRFTQNRKVQWKFSSNYIRYTRHINGWYRCFKIIYFKNTGIRIFFLSLKLSLDYNRHPWIYLRAQSTINII